MAAAPPSPGAARFTGFFVVFLKRCRALDRAGPRRCVAQTRAPALPGHRLASPHKTNVLMLGNCFLNRKIIRVDQQK